MVGYSLRSSRADGSQAAFVQVNPHGYTGAVTTPWGRVTFALRDADQASPIPRARELTDEFPGTVVEEVDTGLFAVASTAGKADEIHARLRS